MSVKNETPAGELSDEQIAEIFSAPPHLRKTLTAAARAVIAADRALRPVVNAPTGWQLVPVVPTQEMLLSGAVLFGLECGRLEEKALSSEDWQAMLAAAPKPPAAVVPAGDALVRQADAQAALAAKDADYAHGVALLNMRIKELTAERDRLRLSHAELLKSTRKAVLALSHAMADSKTRQLYEGDYNALSAAIDKAAGQEGGAA